MKKIILASQSPRRRELLELLGFEYEVIPSDCDENTTKSEPAEYVMELSSMKARDVAGKILNEFSHTEKQEQQNTILTEADKSERKYNCLTFMKNTKEWNNGYIVIGADTIVVHDGEILGKPAGREAAYHMLRALAGDRHQVYTGVTMIDLSSGRIKRFFECTDVEMYDFSDEEIYDYIDTGDPFDKAGGYGVQSKGAFLVKAVYGDFYNVVGLPIARLCKELKKM